jgi:undecaprenyl diphosphate synthase
MARSTPVLEGARMTDPVPYGDPIPRHVAIIMDGNRRWARERGIPEAQGHAAGVEAIRPIV